MASKPVEQVVIVSVKPSRKQRVSKGPQGYSFTEERTFESDSGYDGNLAHRAMSMARTAIEQFVAGKTGEVMIGKFPRFNAKNRLVVTVAVLGPEEPSEQPVEVVSTAPVSDDEGRAQARKEAAEQAGREREAEAEAERKAAEAELEAANA